MDCYAAPIVESPGWLVGRVALSATQLKLLKSLEWLNRLGGTVGHSAQATQIS
jgi:hypothetical protein